MSCWTDKTADMLSQGDIVRLVPLGTVGVPSTILEKVTLPGGKTAWSPVPNSEKEELSFLASGRYLTVLVLSHSCEIDKPERKGRVTVAPVADASKLDAAVRDKIFDYLRFSLFPLPAVPDVGDGYADLRLSQAIDRRHLESAPKLASMTDAGVAKLKRHIVAFFARP